MQKTLCSSTTIITGILSICFICIIIFAQVSYDRLSKPFSFKLSAIRRDLLPAKILPYLDFGFSNILADLYWIRAIQDFVQWDWKDEFMMHYFTNISTLDPKFEYPYLFAIVTIPRSKNVESLDKVAAYSQKGIEAIPTSWKIPYYLGTEYYLFTKKYETPLHYLEIAANVESAPPGVYLTYSSFLTKNITGNKAAQELVKVIYNNTNDEIIKKLSKIGLQESMISQSLEKAIVAYKVLKGKYPKNVLELEEMKLISLPKKFFTFFTITINQNNGSFKVEAVE